MTNKIKEQKRSYLLGILSIILGALITSLSPLTVHLDTVSSSSSTFYRLSFGCITLLILILASGKLIQLLKMPSPLILAAGICLTIDIQIWYYCIEFIGPGLSTLLISTQAIGIAIINHFITKKKPQWPLISSIIIVIIGLGILCLINQNTTDITAVWPVLGCLLSASFYTAFILLLNHRSKDPTESLLIDLYWIHITGSMLVAIIMITTQQSFVIPDIENLQLLMFNGFFISGVAWVLIFNGIKKIPVVLAGLLLLIQPCLSFIWDLIQTAQYFDIQQIIGLFVVIGGLALGIYTSPKRRSIVK